MNIPMILLNFESKLLKRAVHSSGSKYISESYWNEIVSRISEMGMATMNNGAFSISLSNLLSQAKAMDATEMVKARWVKEFLTLKQMILRSQRQESISMGMKHWKRT